MKKMVLVITLVAIATSVSAFAQPDPTYLDNIGMYLDEAGTNSCATLAIGPATAYLVLTKLTSPDVLAWEAKVTFDATLFEGVWVLRGAGATDLGARPGEHTVGLTAPIPAVGGVVVLAEIPLFIGDDGSGAPVSGNAFVNENYFSLFENGLPAYLDGNSDGHSLNPANANASVPTAGTVNDPIFIVNGDCLGVVANDDLSFGSVKSLFR